jgi:hypothetical protein
MARITLKYNLKNLKTHELPGASPPVDREPRGFSLAGKVTNFEVYGSVQHYRLYMNIEFCQVNCGG